MAIAAATVESDVDAVNDVAFRKGVLELLDNLFWELDVFDVATFFAVKVGMRGEVWAVAGGFPLEVDLFNQSTRRECFQAVVNGGQGNGGHVDTCAGVDLISGRVVSLFQQNGEDVLALLGGAQATPLKCNVESGLIFGSEFHLFYEGGVNF